MDVSLCLANTLSAALEPRIGGPPIAIAPVRLHLPAMLLLAADRTPGLVHEPPPFVLQRSLGDFAVNYALNAYCAEVQAMMQLYTALHRNILDLFNEYGVQIMTPAYVNDTPELKVVPKAQWYAAPASPDGGAPK